jgi:hypothetical protein
MMEKGNVSLSPPRFSNNISIQQPLNATTGAPQESGLKTAKEVF